MFEEILYRIEPSTIFMVLIFLISFILVNLSLVRVLDKNRAAAGVLAFLVALGITYGIWWYGFDIQGFIYDLGITQDTLYFAIPIAIIITAFVVVVKLGFSALFLSLGGLLMALSFWAYETEIIFLMGLSLLVVGILILWAKKKRKIPKT